MLTGIDVSWFQGGASNDALAAIDWDKVRDDPLVKFAYARATYGSDLIDDTYALNHDGAKKADIPLGAYHFYRYNDDPDAQAEAFLQAVDGREGNIIPMIDVEEGSFTGKVPFLNQVETHLDRVVTLIEHRYGQRILIYTNPDTWNVYLRNSDAWSGHPLWLAQSDTPNINDLPGGWFNWTIWQSGTRIINGIAVKTDWDVLHPDYDLTNLLWRHTHHDLTNLLWRHT